MDTNDPIIGVKCVPFEDPGTNYWKWCRKGQRRREPSVSMFPKESRRWVLTTDLTDLALPDSEFLSASSEEDALESLRLRFPAPHPALTHVEQPRLTARVYGQPAAAEFITHAVPYLSEKTWDALDYDATMTLAASHSPILISAEFAKSCREWRDFEKSDLVIGDAEASGYALLKFNPSKAKAREKSQATRTAKRKKIESDGQAAAQMRKAIDNLALAIRYSLADCGVALALTDSDESHKADDWEPIDYKSHQSGYRGRYSGDRYRNDLTSSTRTHKVRRDGLSRLLALTIISDKFLGKFAYRRLPGWLSLRETFHALPSDLDPARWGLTVGRYADDENAKLAAFWAAEMAAKPPRNRKAKIAEIETNQKDSNENAA